MAQIPIPLSQICITISPNASAITATEVPLIAWEINTLRPRQNGLYFSDDIFECIFLNENAWISIKILIEDGL